MGRGLCGLFVVFDNEIRHGRYSFGQQPVENMIDAVLRDGKTVDDQRHEIHTYRYFRHCGRPDLKNIQLSIVLFNEYSVVINLIKAFIVDISDDQRIICL